MKRREVNIFSVSFLDLLSGALAAVIILFIVVPKMTEKSREAAEALEDLNLEASQLADMVEQLENSVDSSVFKELMAQVQRVETALAQAEASVQQLNERLQSSQARSEALSQEVASLEEEVERQRRAAEAAREQASRANEDAKLFGVDAQLAVVFQWQENMDIDLYLFSRQYQQWCWYNNNSTPFAKLLKDMTEATGDSYEMIYQPEIVPGIYDLYINIYDTNGVGTTANPRGYIVMYPGTSREKKINLGAIQLSYQGGSAAELGEGTFVRSFTVTENSLN